MRVCFVVSDCNFFLTHRLDLAKVLLTKKLDVRLIASSNNTSEKDLLRIAALGIQLHEIPLRSQCASRIYGYFKYLISLRQTIKKINPEFIFYVTLEISVFGAWLNSFINTKKSFFLITGLGPFFFKKELKYRVARIIQKAVFNFSRIKKNYLFIFQNEDDLEVFTRLGFTQRKYANVIKGNGIDSKQFYYLERDYNNEIIFLFASRLVYSKGIREFLMAARTLAKLYPQAKFFIAGKYNNKDPDSISPNEYKLLQSDQALHYCGEVEHCDMNAFFTKASIFVMPSYGEGLPKVALEAAATGLPLIMSDVPGCRECVNDDVNGFTVEPRNTQDLKNKMELCNKMSDSMIDFGINSSKLIKRDFAIELISEKYLKLLN